MQVTRSAEDRPCLTWPRVLEDLRILQRALVETAC